MGMRDVFRKLFQDKPHEATTKQIQNTWYVSIFILLTTFENMAYIQKHPTWDLFWKTLRMDESKLPSTGGGISCLKNVKK